MITKSAAFTLFKKWLDGRRKLRVDAHLEHIRITIVCTVDLISGDTICLRLADAGYLEIILDPPFYFELVQPKSPRLYSGSDTGELHNFPNTNYESAVVAFYGENTVTFMLLIDTKSPPPAL